MKKVLLSITVASTLLFTGCAHMGGYGSSEMKSVDEVIKTAEVKYADVHEQGIAWQKTKAKITKAKKLVAEANALATEAIYEADQALMQSEEAEKTWRTAVPQ
ncbi:hypothetical protein N8972_00650 [Sulfurospirillum sp.]|nr:hypothetical protein [Sulfurospirillum sp.]